ncbi:MAG: peptide chain release factor N(5)-glutamine methyltransferase [Gemmataceae bacterium]|nr:peptide chain release factor N(5)-glutamine methyltransferase [Gemmataceae bacterium]
MGSLLDWTAKHLAAKNVESARLDAEVLLAHVAGCKRIDLYGMRFAEVASPEIRHAYRDLIRQRLEGCPVAYLVGRKEFYGLEFKVTRAVLIPRPDSEHVVVECLKVMKAMKEPRILDLGVGSGNLAVSIAKHLPTSQVTAIDKSPDALAVARENAAKHGVAERIRFLKGDVFSPLGANETFHCIISNPPYIPDGDIPNLPIGVRNYEPTTALAAGADGFAVFDRIIAEASARLQHGDHLIVEIGSPQEAPARVRLAAIATLTLAPTIIDSAGHPRVLHAVKS